MFRAQELLDEAEEFLDVGLVAILADAGGGKTQMAAQLTAPQEGGRPAGIFLQGRSLHKGQSLNDLAKNFSINGIPMPSMESLLAAVDAAGKRACCRLPILIDGLNEAENPQDWKPELASLSESIKKFPNALVVCTLRTGERKKEGRYEQRQSQSDSRESFAVMSLPDNIKLIENEGFGSDVDEAIDKYFSYFKIDSGDAEIPSEFLQHPLTLRIFCEVTNPKRETEVKVDYFPTSLSPLFEKYVVNAAKRISEMSNLSHHYNVNEVDKAIYILGIELWNCRKREIDESRFRKETSDDSHAWDSSIVNLLTQEGIIFRNPGTKPYEYVITPTYDALGGHIIANALLTQNQNIFFNWLDDPNTVALFTGNDSHELSYDTFKSLVLLAPSRMQRRHIWQNVSSAILKKNAIILASEIDAEYLDKETVIALLQLLYDSSGIKNRVFTRFCAARAVEEHPLNANVLDSTLREMTVSNRDIIWTEWVRSTRPERFNDLLALEDHWKQKLEKRTPSDQLRAKWVMWLLTSTDHELRDIATRALYWFGRGNPTALFEETLTALSINDPYVPERMLAASYGVAMARHVDIGNKLFITEILPKFARSIYDSMFARNALVSTTHCLMREYGSQILEIASFHDSNLLSSEEMLSSKASFEDIELDTWGISNSVEVGNHGFDSPFNMDFENYTIGSLVSDRGNYDFENQEYLKIRSQILWRIEKLGWSSEIFKDIDGSIAMENRRGRTESDAKQIDRYGKKYSWIAFFEMSGFLNDLKKISRGNERDWSWNPDIDPSFPASSSKRISINVDFLGDPHMAMKDWIVHGSMPDVTPYLELAEIHNEVGSWILLDGYMDQENRTLGRHVFCFFRSFLIPSSEADSFIENLSNQDLGGRWLPEKPSTSYTFAGEIPWSLRFVENEYSEMTFIVKEENVKVNKIQKKFFLNGTQLDLDEVDIVELQIGVYEGIHGDKLFSKQDIEQIEVRETPVEVEEVWQHTITYNNILIPVCDFSLEYIDSAANDSVFSTTLSKELASDLGLIGQPQTFDLFTDQGVRATCNVVDNSDNSNSNKQLFYIKEDLLNKVLKENDLTLIWAIWGERKHSYDHMKNFTYKLDRPDPTYKVFNFIKRYDPSK